MEAHQIPYGVSDFKRVRLENFYYVDKSRYIRRLEDWGNFLFFVRPRRFGKSLFCDMLRCCYGIVTMSRLHRTRIYFRIPNECVRKQIFEYLRGEYAKMPNAVRVGEFQDKFERFAWEGEWKELLTYLAGKYRDNGSPRDGIDGEARINGYLCAYLLMDSVYIAKPEFSHPAGYSDFAFFPDRTRNGADLPEHSYVIELKYSKSEATEAELAAKHEEAIAQLQKYAADPQVAKLAAGTQLHFITCEFKGKELVKLAEVECSSYVESKVLDEAAS